MTQKKIRCVLCPLGCTITINVDKEVCQVNDGPHCKLGIEYAKNEARDPKRIVTTSVQVTGGEWPLVSVKTTCPVPLEKIFPIINETKKLVLMAPVNNGQILCKNILGTNANLIATRTVEKKNKKRRDKEK